MAAKSELTEVSYRHVSELSDATEDVHAESLADDDMNELDDYEMLVKATQRKMKILDDADDQMSESTTKAEKADEFLRNFFIKFGMKKTLDQFQTEWYELKATGELDMGQMPNIPPIYQRNQELSD